MLIVLLLKPVLALQHSDMLRSTISLIIIQRESQIMGINAGLNVANESVLNMFTPQ